jgi:hypothetical protein
LNFIDSFALQLWIFQFLVVLFLVGGIVTLAVGVGLIFGSDGTLRFLGAMNRWVSTRRVLSPIEGSRENGRPVQGHQRWLAVVFIAGAAFAIIGLGTGFDAGAVSHAFGLGTRPSSVAPWLVESARWTLIVGNLIAIVIGIGLGFFPDQLAALEARGVRWYSNRRLAAGANDMNLSLDDWVAASPRAAGWIISVAGLVLVGDFAFVWFGAR